MRRRDFLTVAGATALLPFVAHGAANTSQPKELDIVVGSASELATALASADGVTIGCKPGSYGKLVFNRKPAKAVTVTSTDSAKKAEFDGMLVNKSARFTVRDVHLEYTYAKGHDNWHKGFEILNSEDCIVADCLISGSNGPSGFGHAEGLFVRWSKGTGVVGNKFTGFTRQLHVHTSVGTRISDNELTDMRGDGITLTNVTGGTIVEKNYIHDFRCSDNDEYHRDGIEFWSEKGVLDGLIIRDNILDIGDGPWFQSIFGRNTVNAVFSGNKIRNFHTHGITPGKGGRNTLIHGNQLIRYANMSLAQNVRSQKGGTSTPEIFLRFTKGPGKVTNNTTPSPIRVKKGWTAFGNVVVR